MVNRTHENHLKHFNNPWRVLYGQCKSEPMEWREECKRAARLIYENSTKPIKVHLSGGVDSEVVARSFLLESIPFTAVICRHDNNKNYHDIKYAIEFCKENNLLYQFVDLDRDWFMSEGSIPYIKKYKTATFNVAQIFYCFEQIDGHHVLGLGDLYIHKNNSPFFISEFEHIYRIEDYLNVNQIEGTPFFFKYTPEMIVSYLEKERLKKWFIKHNYRRGYFSNKEDKFNLYKDSFPELKKRPIYHGYETVRGYTKKQTSLFINKRAKVKVKFYIDELVKYMREGITNA